MSVLEVAPARPPAEENGTEEGLRIASFDGGGPGSYSQLLMLKEVIRRMEWDKQSQGAMDSDDELDFDEDELCPADYFHLMGGVGFGAYCALMLGRLRLTIGKATEELIKLAHTMFPNTPSEILTPDANSDRLKNAVEDMLRRNGFPVDMPLKGKIGTGQQCKVVVFIPAVSTPGNCTPFRNYSARSNESPKCTFVEAACAALSGPSDFSPVSIRMGGIETFYAGIPFGFNNPTRKVLHEGLVVFKEQRRISFILSLGGGKQSTSSIGVYACLDGNNLTLETRLAMDSERVDDELALQLTEVDLYLRLDVDKGMENIKNSSWHQLSAIGAHTRCYLGNGPTTTNIDKALCSLRDKEYLTFAQISGAARQAISRVPIERMLSCVERNVKNMCDIATQSIDKITIIDAIGNRRSFLLQDCATYEMLQDMVKLYFKHQKAPGSSFVNKGEYKLVHGPDRRTVKPGEWTYLQAPNLELEMSMVVRKKQGTYCVQCPKCDAPFNGKGRNGWAICPNRICKMRYQYQAKRYKFLPASSNKERGYSRNVAKDSRLSGSQAKAIESADQFRLVSVVQQNELDRRYRYLPWLLDINVQMNVPDDELSDDDDDDGERG